MKNVEMIYNPYLMETEIHFDGEEYLDNKNSSLHDCKKLRLQLWMERLCGALEKDVNEEGILINFSGTAPDFQDLFVSCEQHNQKNTGTQFICQHVHVMDPSDKIHQLKELMAEIQEGPFEELKTDRVQKNFEKSMNDEFEIAIIATMSSGKSTLINAFLGQELIPSKNEACTAKITRIYNREEQETFSAETYDADDQAIQSIREITPADLVDFNENHQVQTIHLKGSIPHISSKGMNLVMIDTPGPNNSRDMEHRIQTFRIIQNEDQPIVMYVLNGSQLGISDDNRLLADVSEAMKVSGKQSKDRFIFVLNQADKYDVEAGESLQLALDNAKKYLEGHGIEHPNIYPISAQLAKLLRMQQSGETLTAKQKRDAYDYERFLEQPEMQMHRYPTLTPSVQKAIQNRIECATNEKEEAIIYSGVPVIEEVINEYLEKYAVTSKIKNGVESFRKVIEQENMLLKIEEELEQNETKRKELAREINQVNALLENGDHGRTLIHDIQSLSDETSKEHLLKTRKTFGKKLLEVSEPLRQEIQVKQREADLMIKQFQKEVEMLCSSMLIDLEKGIDKGLRHQANTYATEYKKSIENLLNTSIELNIATSLTESVLTVNLPDADSLIAMYTEEREVFVGTVTRSNTSKKWYKPWTWGESSTYEKDVYETHDFVDMEKVISDCLNPVDDYMENLLQAAEVQAQEQTDTFKKMFLAQLDLLEAAIRKNLDRVQRLTTDQEMVIEEVERRKANKEWLRGIIEKLDVLLTN
ncbi:dynamin family protein [Exiguobacterium sp. SH0S2]|uniref:dynamin family protein n=1 Tax=Exiguobacterium sp. SH0S2 TaxID=2510950 RepID=UPI00103C2A36|nr:dynamin family protein [Exiguobacterium sp. SH0S2]TCI63153.1 GTPase [Exiguobacterium sp. SH0S2]